MGLPNGNIKKSFKSVLANAMVHVQAGHVDAYQMAKVKKPLSKATVQVQVIYFQPSVLKTIYNYNSFK